MNHPIIRHVVAAACVGFASLALAAPRTFVSGSGNDTNPCSRDAPCRSFATAINAADAGGEVIALDTAGYGPFAIGKSISIISPPGIIAAISNGVPVPSTYGNAAAVDINAGPSDRIVLRGLNVNMPAGDVSGVVIRSAGIVHIENAALKGAGTATGQARAIFAKPSSSLQLYVKDTQIRSFVFGMHLFGALGATVHATIDRVRVQDTNFGILAINGVQAAMRDTVSTGNGVGFYAVTTNLAQGVASLVLERCAASHNTGQGVVVDPNSVFSAASVTISNCVITNNNVGVQSGTIAPPQGGFVFSRHNNTIRENGTDISGVLQGASSL